MGEGRGSAIVATVLLFCLLLHCDTAHATTYAVGGAKGWTLDVVGWPYGKRFMAGDILVFNYNAAAHDVVSVNKVGYNTCTVPRGASKVYHTGKDQIKLVKGQNFFICSFPGHCQSGMKIAITAM
ncbi:Basic blue protein [Vitis vinifera]|uniref:Basic blue protein n=1 Tax=Vitis vinifera TaxID=29760 RepID=A0A438H958_VITVI|nr:Basic blue protein [Vitis vinifera]